MTKYDVQNMIQNVIANNNELTEETLSAEFMRHGGFEIYKNDDSKEFTNQLCCICTQDENDIDCMVHINEHYNDSGSDDYAYSIRIKYR